MDSNKWGTNLWFFLHSVSMNYPPNPTEQDKLHMRNFIYSISYILPCSECRENFRTHLITIPIRLESKKDFVYWVIDIHNQVNIQLGKRVVNHNEVIQAYEKIYGKKIDLNENTRLPESQIINMMPYMLGGILTFAIVFLIWKKLK